MSKRLNSEVQLILSLSTPSIFEALIPLAHSASASASASGSDSDSDSDKQLRI